MAGLNRELVLRPIIPSWVSSSSCSAYYKLDALMGFLFTILGARYALFNWCAYNKILYGKEQSMNAREKAQFKSVGGNGIPATLYTLFVPLNSNDGRPMPQPRLSWVQAQILHFARGLTTLFPGTGFWVNHAELYKDRILPVQVVTPTDPEADDRFARLVVDMTLVMKQEQIFLFAQPVLLLEPVWPREQSVVASLSRNGQAGGQYRLGR